MVTKGVRRARAARKRWALGRRWARLARQALGAGAGRACRQAGAGHAGAGRACERGVGSQGTGVQGAGATRHGRAQGALGYALGALSLFLTQFDSILFLSQFLDIVREPGS